MTFVTHKLFCWECKLHFSFTEVLKESYHLAIVSKIKKCVDVHTALDFLNTLHGRHTVWN
jgi:hypothetical protein